MLGSEWSLATSRYGSVALSAQTGDPRFEDRGADVDFDHTLL
jgi:hypothetical protein